MAKEMSISASDSKVKFNGIKSFYPPGVDIAIQCVVQEGLERSTRDWMGIFKVGFNSSRDYYTFQWVPHVPIPEGEHEVNVSITYPSRSIPAQDGHNYVFGYVARSGKIVCMSDAFVIAPPPEEEPEFVEIEASEGGESVLMITTKETKEVAKKLEVVQLEKYELQSACDTLKQQLTASEEDKVKEHTLLEEALGSKRQLAEHIEELQRQIAEKNDESLDKDVQIQALRNDFEDEMKKQVQFLDIKESEIVKLKNENAVLQNQVQSSDEQKSTVDDLKKDLVTVKTELEEEKREFATMTEKLMNENSDMRKVLNSNQITLDKVVLEKTQYVSQVEDLERTVKGLQTDLDAKEAKIISLTEELNIAQSNATELLCARPEDRPVVPDEKTVDPQAHNALLAAYEKVQDDKRHVGEEVEGLRNEIARLRKREDELLCKLDLGKEEYVKKATEVEELNRKLKKMEGSVGKTLSPEEASQTVVISMAEVSSPQNEEVATLKGELETARTENERLSVEIEELQESQDEAISELQQRKDENNTLDQQVNVLQKELTDLRAAFASRDAEVIQIEERADRRIHDKNGEIDVLNDRLAEMQLLLEEARKQVDRSQSELVDMREALRLNEASLQAVRGGQQPFHQPRPAQQQVRPSAPPPNAPPPVVPVQNTPYPRFNQPQVQVPRAPTESTQSGSNQQCPVCSKVLSAAVLPTHVNSHFEH